LAPSTTPTRNTHADLEPWTHGRHRPPDRAPL
jgi:hypothetical protein